MIRISNGFISTSYDRWINLDEVKFIYIDYDPKLPEMAAIIAEMKNDTLFNITIDDIEKVKIIFEDIFA